MSKLLELLRESNIDSNIDADFVADYAYDHGISIEFQDAILIADVYNRGE